MTTIPKAAQLLLVAASHALRSYQYGNGSPDLAKATADSIDAALSLKAPAGFPITGTARPNNGTAESPEQG